MSNHYSVPTSKIDDLVTALSGLEGFMCLVDAENSRRRYSALPDRHWHLPADGPGFQQSMEAIHQDHTRIAGADRTGFVAGSLFYDAGCHTVPGFHSTKPIPATVGWAGLYLWRLDVPGGSADETAAGPGVLTFDPACPKAVRKRILALLEKRPTGVPRSFRITQPFQATVTPAEYREGVARVLEYIRAGDCYQANLSQQFTGRYSGAPWPAWLALMRAIPVPYGGYLDTGNWQLLSVSPELFVEIKNGNVISKPIKGTRPRSDDPRQDQALIQDLMEHPKDRAENLMIVDLIRNDLSRFCEAFSVKVPGLFQVESYRNVHQLVSTVTGRLKVGVSPLDALISAFPGGSITGAPKRRAMEIIDELEPHQRGPYCGSLFWWDADGHLTSNIAIRSLQTFSDGTIRAWAGCGIVADSDPDDEYQESISKIQRLLDTLENLDAATDDAGG